MEMLTCTRHRVVASARRRIQYGSVQPVFVGASVDGLKAWIERPRATRSPATRAGAWAPLSCITSSRPANQKAQRGVARQSDFAQASRPGSQARQACQPPGPAPLPGLNQPVTSVKRVWSRPLKSPPRISLVLLSFPSPRPPPGSSRLPHGQSFPSLHAKIGPPATEAQPFATRSNQIRPLQNTRPARWPFTARSTLLGKKSPYCLGSYLIDPPRFTVQ